MRGARRPARSGAFALAVTCAVALAPSRGAAGGSPTPTGTCPPDTYRDYEPGLCGKGKGAGVCRAKPAACDAAYAPVCGCDGKIHPSACAAQRAGVDLDVNGRCRDLVPGWASCGARLCDTRASYCEIVLSDVAELPTDFVCRPFPPGCRPDAGAAASCACFPAGTPCLSFCGYIETGGLRGFHLTCRR